MTIKKVITHDIIRSLSRLVVEIEMVHAFVVGKEPFTVAYSC